MTEHTKTPWHTGSTEHTELIMAFRDNRECVLAELDTDDVEMDESDANAAFIVKAVNNHNALLEFFRWAMREGPWDGCDLDGGSVQDKAEALGLIVKTEFDAEKHGLQSEFEEGDDYFEYAPQLRPAVGGSSKP